MRQKGSAECHTFSPKGAENYDKIQWAGKQTKCPHLRYLGKQGQRCVIDNNARCPENPIGICPVLKDSLNIN